MSARILGLFVRQAENIPGESETHQGVVPDTPSSQGLPERQGAGRGEALPSETEEAGDGVGNQSIGDGGDGTCTPIYLVS